MTEQFFKHILHIVKRYHLVSSWLHVYDNMLCDFTQPQQKNDMINFTEQY